MKFRRFSPFTLLNHTKKDLGTVLIKDNSKFDPTSFPVGSSEQLLGDIVDGPVWAMFYNVMFTRPDSGPKSMPELPNPIFVNWNAGAVEIIDPQAWGPNLDLCARAKGADGRYIGLHITVVPSLFEIDILHNVSYDQIIDWLKQNGYPDITASTPGGKVTKSYPISVVGFSSELDYKMALQQAWKKLPVLPTNAWVSIEESGLISSHHGPLLYVRLLYPGSK